MKAAKNENNKFVRLLQDFVSQLILQQTRFRKNIFDKAN